MSLVRERALNTIKIGKPQYQNKEEIFKIKYELNTKINYFYEKFTTRLFKLFNFSVGEQKLCKANICEPSTVQDRPNRLWLGLLLPPLNFFKVSSTLVF